MRLVLLLLLLLTSASAQIPSICTPRTTPATFYVDNTSTTTPATGSSSAPYHSIATAMALVRPGDIVKIASGLYREVLVPQCPGLLGHSITIERWGTGSNPIISGAEPFSSPSSQWVADGSGYRWDWAPESQWNADVSSNGYFTFRNPYAGFNLPSTAPAIVATRTEMVIAFHANSGEWVPLSPVTSILDLSPGTFYIETTGECDYDDTDEYGFIDTINCAPESIYARFWNDASPSAAQPELAIRPVLFSGFGNPQDPTAGGYYNLSHLSFRYANNRVQIAAVCLAQGPIDCGAQGAETENDRIVYGQGSVLIDVETAFNNSAGIDLSGDYNIYIGSTSRNNGQLGIKGSCNSCELEDIYTYGNNYKYYDVAWESGGIKMLFTRNTTFTRINSSYNNGPGIWLDAHNHNNVIQGSLISHNLHSGIFIELFSFDNLIQHNIVTGTRLYEYQFGSGIEIASSVSNYIYHNSILGNEATGILLEPDSRSTDGNYYNKFINNIIAFNGSNDIWGNTSTAGHEIYARESCGNFTANDEVFTNNLIYNHSSSPSEYPDSTLAGSTLAYGSTCNSTYLNSNSLSFIESYFGEGGNGYLSRSSANNLDITIPSIIYEGSFQAPNPDWSDIYHPWIVDISTQQTCDHNDNQSCENIPYDNAGASVDAYYDSDWIYDQLARQRTSNEDKAPPEASNWDRVRIGPNPVTSTLTIAGLPVGPVQYRILSTLGRQVAEGVIDNTLAQLPAERLAVGVYILQFVYGGSAHNTRFTVVR